VQFSGLRVVSRTSVMQFKGAKKSIPEIVAALNVDTVVESSLLQDGNRVRMVVQLVDARHDRHMWAHTYEGDWRNGQC
jgi:TolB-like protein